MKCKAEGSLRICGCKPFFYNQIDGVNCSPAALKCFIKWMGTHNSSCNCPKPCTDFFFSINSIKRMSWLVVFINKTFIIIIIIFNKQQKKKGNTTYKIIIISFISYLGLLILVHHFLSLYSDGKFYHQKFVCDVT